MSSHWGNQLTKAISEGGYNKFVALASALDVSESTISRWAAGKSISIENAIRLCDEMNISMDWLFRSTDEFGEASVTPQGNDNLSELETLLNNLPPDALSHLEKFLEHLNLSK